jgi:uncharacterized protein
MDIDTETLKTHTVALIHDQNTMTLATAKNEKAWSAPVYYVYQDSGFYFFSAPDSRHILEALESDQAAASIHAPASLWQEIRGVQMSGSIDKVSVGIKAASAIRAYLKKFPFTKDFFENESIDLTAFSQRFRVRLYRLKAHQTVYLDNSIRFGFKETVVL